MIEVWTDIHGITLTCEPIDVTDVFNSLCFDSHGIYFRSFLTELGLICVAGKCSSVMAAKGMRNGSDIGLVLFYDPSNGYKSRLLFSFDMLGEEQFSVDIIQGGDGSGLDINISDLITGSLRFSVKRNLFDFVGSKRVLSITSILRLIISESEEQFLPFRE